MELTEFQKSILDRIERMSWDEKKKAILLRPPRYSGPPVFWPFVIPRPHVNNAQPASESFSVKTARNWSVVEDLKPPPPLWPPRPSGHYAVGIDPAVPEKDETCYYIRKW